MLPPCGTVDLWTVFWPRLVPAALQTLTSADAEKAACFRIREDRSRFTAARSLLRRLSGEYLGADPLSLTLETGPHGKPCWAGPDSRLSFNISHSGNRVLLAFATQAEIGVDVQEIDRGPRFNPMKTATYAFHPEERAALAAVEEDARPAMFAAIWTAKEAVIKAAGLGLFGALDRFSVLPLPPEGQWGRAVLSPSAAEAQTPWRHTLLTVGEGYRASLAVSGENPFEINRKNTSPLEVS